MNDVGARFIELIKVLEDYGVLSSRADTARKLNYKPQAFNEILQGRVNVSVDLIQKICIDYNINPDYVLLGIGSPFKEKYAHLNAHFNAQVSTQKPPPNEKGSFKQSLNTGPPGEQKECEKCKEKDQIIETQKITIRTQQDNIYTKSELIETLKEKIEELTHKSGGQKRKAS